jgi:hypothetical protein
MLLAGSIAAPRLFRSQEAKTKNESPEISPSQDSAKVVSFGKYFVFYAAGVAKLAYAADSKSN